MQHFRRDDAYGGFFLLADGERFVRLDIVLDGVGAVRTKRLGEDWVRAITAVDRIAYFEAGRKLQIGDNRVHRHRPIRFLKIVRPDLFVTKGIGHNDRLNRAYLLTTWMSVSRSSIWDIPW